MDKIKAIQHLSLENIGHFLDRLAEKSDNVYWLSSPDLKKIQYISPAFDKIWGYSRQSLYENPDLWISYLHPDDAKAMHLIEAMAERIKRLGEHARYEENYRIVRPNGEIRWIIDRGFPIYDEAGNCCGVTGVAVDVTKERRAEEELRKAKEKAEAANKAKTEFLENMRHDIRTPLTGMIGFAQLIRGMSTDHKINEYADNLIASSCALLEFLNEILEIIRIDEGDLPLCNEKFNLQEKIMSVIDLTQPTAKEKQLKLTFNYDKQIPKYLIGDAKRIQRIILELVSNALNFTAQGYVTVSAQLVNIKNRSAVIKFIVEDTGIGISADQHEEIFARFKRLTPAYQGVYKGVGLGLNIVKQFIADLEGEIYLTSEVGKGSQFIAIVSLKQALTDDDIGVEETAARSVGPSIAGSVATNSAINKKRVLLVDDEAVAAFLEKNMLEELDCLVEVATDGKSTLSLVISQTFDLIFMVVDLPDIKGYDIVKKIRQWETKLNRHTPVFALKSTQTEDKQSYIEMGFDGVLIKPLLKETAVDILTAFALPTN